MAEFDDMNTLADGEYTDDFGQGMDNPDLGYDEQGFGKMTMPSEYQEYKAPLEKEVYQRSEEDIYNKKFNPVPKPSVNIGTDLEDKFIDDIIMGKDRIDMGKLESFSAAAMDRDQTYQLLDSMSEDSIIAAALEVYAEDATETNDQGQIVWVESDDENVAKFVQFLLDSMEVDKNAYHWVKSLCKYGDLYLKLFRESETQDELLSEEEQQENRTLNEGFEQAYEKPTLNEDVKVKLFSKNDKYVHYIEAVPNPAEMFELRKLGKTYAYVKSNVAFSSTMSKDTWLNTTFKYGFKKKDVTITNATSYVHACLMDDTSRVPETVDIFLPKDGVESEDAEYTTTTYTVRRGQSILAPAFKVWRELMLLENSLLLNRLTKSSILRVISIEAKDLPKAEAKRKLLNVKNMIEQKTAINTNTSMMEYTNPGPMENNIYTITRDGQGVITASEIGGDVDVKNIADLDYFKNRLFGTLRIPAQYLGETDDNTGFNGGTSLSLISSRYAKAIKRIQNALILAITDAVNLMLIDKGLTTYINKFQIKMLPPTTQEEIDRRDNLQNKLNLASDVLNILSDIQDPATRLKLSKQLLSNVVSDAEVISIIQDEIDNLEEMEENGEMPEGGDDDDFDNFGVGHSTHGAGGSIGNMEDLFGDETSEMPNEEIANLGNEEPAGEQILPTPAELNAGDFTDNNNAELV